MVNRERGMGSRSTLQFWKCLPFLLFNISFLSCCGQDTISVSGDLYLIRLSEQTYIHVSYYKSPDWGRFSSNGLVYVGGESALLFDTPMSDSISMELFNWISDSLKANIVAFVPNHWHNDCTEGMDLLKERNIPTYATQLTAKTLREKKLPGPEFSFAKKYIFKMGGQEIICEYLGAGHTEDNITVWIPSEKILFGGCMVRSLEAKSLGNIADANLKAWPKTINRLIKRYGKAKVVIPGHGAYGDAALLNHTLILLKESRQ